MLDELPIEPLLLPEPLPELLGELLDEGELLLPLAALPLFALSWLALEPAPALSRLHAATPTASAKAVRAAVKAFMFMHLL
ncbi:MAG: hypothetical protein ABR570_01205 [Burkholderiales bacterium]